jgi:hypothetical protein
MHLTRHLSNEELSEMIFDSDQQRLHRTLSVLPEWVRAATAHPDAFWERQQVEIRRRITAVPERSPAQTITAWAGAFAVVLLAAFLLSDNPTLRPPTAQSDSDQELLVAVEQTVQSGVPAALEPATILADEITRSQPTFTSHRAYKEDSNEDQ